MRLSDEIKPLKDWNPKLGDKFWFVSFSDGSPEDARLKEKSFALREVREGVHGLKAYELYDSSHFSLDSKSLFKKVYEDMEYEDKWILNEGQEIPDDADKLEKNGSVVAYRLPKKVPEIGDKVYLKYYSGGWSWQSHTIVDKAGDYYIISLYPKSRLLAAKEVKLAY